MGGFRIAQIIVLNALGIAYDLPVHDVPFPVYPELHVQLYDPSVLLQKALTSQLWAMVVHSLISKRDKY